MAFQYKIYEDKILKNEDNGCFISMYDKIHYK